MAFFVSSSNAKVRKAVSTVWKG